MSYDIFISYSRKDNQQGRVTELVEYIKDNYQTLTHEKLSCFFDLTEIKAMDDWRNRILGGLRESKLLLLVLSPDYLTSPNCEWEIVEFLKYEHSRAVQGEGVAAIYFVEIPGLDTLDFEKQAAEWVIYVRRRNHVDLRPWHDEGAKALKRADIRAQLEDLEHSLIDRLSRLRRIVNAPGNLPAHNSRFVGREVEMGRLHQAVGLGQYGLLTAVQGVGGLGKTALAIQYAYAYADFYPGGRWLVGCAGSSSLAAVVRILDSDLGIQFTDEEKLDDSRAAKRILGELERRAEACANARAGERQPPEPRALLIFDNVDNQKLLQTPNVDLISGCKWLHVITTTRLDPDCIGRDDKRYFHLPIDELPEDDALRLIEEYQPQGRFPNNTERIAARGIVRLLQGFTLAVEVVAVYLGERKGLMSCVDLLKRLNYERVDEIAGQTAGSVSHVEKLISVTLAPTLETLNEIENRILMATTLLPPDSVPLPWLRAVIAENHPKLATDAEPGYDDPWLQLINHLIGLRLLQVIEWADDGRTPRLCRIHRLIQTVAKQRAVSELTEIKTSLMRVVTVRIRFLNKEWLKWNNRWEIYPLSSFLEQALESDSLEVSFLADILAACMVKLGEYKRAEPLLCRTLEIREKILGPEHPDTLTSVAHLGSLLESKGDYARAELLYRRALEAEERILGPEHPNTLECVNGLAVLLSNNGDYIEAESLYRRVLEVRERNFGPEHPDTLTILSNLAVLLARKGDYLGADPLSRHVLEVLERAFGPEHLETLSGVSNLAVLLLEKGDYIGAEPLLRRALKANEQILGPEHPNTLISLNNLAGLLKSKGDYIGAEPLFHRALEANERILGPDHPNTLAIVSNLAELFEMKGDFNGADPLERRALEANERILGPEHPYTIASINDLALLLMRKGDYAEAELLFRRALNIHERILGPEHPNTLMVKSNFAVLLKNKGDYVGAEPLNRHVLEARVRILGPEHPDTITSLSNLAKLLTSKGDNNGAEPLCRRVLEVRERVLGPEHPDTLTSVNCLAELLTSKGDDNGAEPLCRRVLEVRERVLGPEHPDTLTSVNYLAFLLSRKGDYAGAETLCRRVLEIRERVLGPEHPDTLLSVSNLAGLLTFKGDYARAMSLECRVLEARQRVLGPKHPATLTSMKNLDWIRAKMAIKHR